MFSIIRESLKLDKLPNKRVSQIFACLLFALIFLFNQFPMGDPHIKAVDKLMQLEWGQLVNVLQELYVQNQLFTLLSSANILYYVSDFAFEFIILLVCILFLNLQVAAYRKNDNKTVFKRFFTKQAVIWLFFFLLIISLISFASVFSPLPFVVVSLCLFTITQAIFVPTIIIDYNYRLLQAFFVSRQLMQGFKLNFLVNFMLCHFFFSFIPQFILSIILTEGLIFNIILSLVKVFYTLISLRCLYIYYLYLSEYNYPQIRALGLLDLSDFFNKLNKGVYPMHTDAEKAALLARLKDEYDFDQNVANMLFNGDIGKFNKDVLQTELPLKKPLDKLFKERINNSGDIVDKENNDENSLNKQQPEPTQTVEQKENLLEKNLAFIKERLKDKLAAGGVKIGKDAYLDEAAESIASDFYRSDRTASDLNKLLDKKVDYLNRCERTIPLDEHKEGLD